MKNHIYIYKSNSDGAVLQKHRPEHVLDLFECLIVLQESVKGYKDIYYGNICGKRVYADGTGSSSEFFNELPDDIFIKMYERAKETCIENCDTIRNFKKEYKKRGIK